MQLMLIPGYSTWKLRGKVGAHLAAPLGLRIDFQKFIVEVHNVSEFFHYVDFVTSIFHLQLISAASSKCVDVSCIIVCKCNLVVAFLIFDNSWWMFYSKNFQCYIFEVSGPVTIPVFYCPSKVFSLAPKVDNSCGIWNVWQNRPFKPFYCECHPPAKKKKKRKNSRNVHAKLEILEVLPPRPLSKFSIKQNGIRDFFPDIVSFKSFVYGSIPD